ncbi:MAG: 6-pyruvoyl-tetrahydropterin synthase-related protein [Betaproteobacteria bacterium]
MNSGFDTSFLRRAMRLNWLGDLAFALLCAILVAATLGIGFLNSNNWPTGGDAASHLLYAKLYADDLLFSGQILPWVPEVFGGMPFLSYYFPLPFIVIAVLSKGLGLASAFKWGGFLAAMVLPGAVFSASRRWLGFSWQAALFAGLGALAFLLHEQNSIWGGNLLSTLAGEFAYSYGVLFAVLAMMAWARAINLGRGWLLAAVLEAASGFSHGFPLLVVGFSTAFLLLDGALAGDHRENLRRLGKSVALLLRGHLLAFALLGGWLWPMLEMHGLTIPNDASFPLSGWQDLLPVALWPSVAGGVLGLMLLLVPGVRRAWGAEQRLALCYFVSAAGLAAVAFLAGDQLGLADIRFFPLVWLLGAIACGWLFGQALHAVGRPVAGPESRLPVLSRGLCALAASLALVGWIGAQVQKAPDWGLWNHSGLDPKPQWRNLSNLFPAMRGDLWSPRLAFEHDPANNDIGSTRTLEALPMFLNHRPVLEGLYMESAVLGPAIYQLQSEISAQPSSPLVRFPSGSLDIDFAARHMNFLHTDTLLVRSAAAKQGLDGSGLFIRLGESPPFALYRLKRFDSHLAEVVTAQLSVRPMQDWMQDAFAWFRTRSRFDTYLPVYVDEKAGKPFTVAAGPFTATPVREKSLSRHELVFESDAIGRPHLIKMAYHPRWQLASRGSLHVAGPGFMLVVPEEKEIRLVYGHTLVGKIGMVSTSAALLLVLFLLWRGRAVAATPLPTLLPAGWRRHWPPILAGWFFLVAVGTYYAIYSPERIYKEAWDAFSASAYEKAADKFLLAHQLRRPPAKKEEALFWFAKAKENAGDKTEARARYLEVFERYHGYWVPESLYTYVVLSRQSGQGADVGPMVKRLHDEYPNNPWTLRLDQGQ